MMEEVVMEEALPEAAVSAISLDEQSSNDCHIPALGSNALPLETANFFEITVTSPTILGEGVSAYVTYAVEAKTTLELYNKNLMQVARRYSDFVWLHDQLVEKHKGIIVPSLPDKALLQTNKISGNRFSERFLEFRRRELQKFLSRVVSHPSLCTSQSLQLFLEEEDSAVLTASREDETASKGGFLSFLGKGMKAMAQLIGTEVDPWFTEKTQYIENLNTRLELVATAAAATLQHSYELQPKSQALTEAAKGLAGLEREAGKDGLRCTKAVGTGLNRLSEITAQIQLIEYEKNESVSRSFVDPFRDYQRMIAAVQRALMWRLEKLGDYQGAHRDNEQKQQRLTARPDDAKLKAAAEAAQQRLEETREIYESTSEMVRAELVRFETVKATEIHAAIVEYAQANMNRAMQELHLWKAFVTDLQ